MFGALLHSYLIIVGALGLLGLFSAIPGMRIDTMMIEGNTAVSTENITQAVESVFAKPFAFVVARDIPLWAGQETIAAAVYALDSHIRDVEVSGRFSRTLSVSITEESPVMLWCGSDVPTSTVKGEDVCWFANAEGVIYSQAPEYPNAPYVKFYTTPAAIFSEPYPRAHEYPSGYAVADATTRERLSIFSDALPERGFRPTHIGVTADADVVVFTTEGTQFLFSLSRNI
jgi:hypothetical protein